MKMDSSISTTLSSSRHFSFSEGEERRRISGWLWREEGKSGRGQQIQLAIHKPTPFTVAHREGAGGLGGWGSGGEAVGLT